MTTIGICWMHINTYGVAVLYNNQIKFKGKNGVLVKGLLITKFIQRVLSP